MRQAGELFARSKRFTDRRLIPPHWQPHANPVVVWDIFGEKGHLVRATVSDLGPLLLARLLNLNDVQSGVLNIIFRIADDQGLLLLDFKDLRAITQYIGDAKPSSRISTVISVAHRLVPSSAGCCRWNSKAQHTSLVSRCWISKTGCAPMPTVKALSISSAPRNFIRCRNCTPPACCGCFQSCMNNCRSGGDLEKPKLVFFFDEAHLLFNDAPQVLLDKIEQVIRLIRSKGVGVWFVSQNPSDIPDTCWGSSVIAFNMLCGLLRQKIRKQ